MKKHKNIDNPWALANYMKNKGFHSHKNEQFVKEGEKTQNITINITDKLKKK